MKQLGVLKNLLKVRKAEKTFEAAWHDLQESVAEDGERLRDVYLNLLRGLAEDILETSAVNGDSTTNYMGIGEVDLELFGKEFVKELGLDEDILRETTHSVWGILIDAAEKFEKARGVFLKRKEVTGVRF